MTVPVYDASALLAVIFDEPGADVALQYLAMPGGEVSAVNWSEVGAKLAERGVTETEISSELSPLGLDVVPFDEAQAVIAAGFRPITRKLGLSLGDRCCLALARMRGARVITADVAWLKLESFNVTAIR